MPDRRKKLATVSHSQVVVGNSGQRASSSSSSPPTASVRNQSSSVSIGQPGAPGSNQNVGAINNIKGVVAPQSQFNSIARNPVMGQATPGATPISYAAGNQPGTTPGPTTPNIPGLDRGAIQSYVEQFKSGALNPQQFADQLRTYLGQYRDQAVSGIQGAVDARRNPARQSASQATGRAASTLANARQTVNSAAQTAQAAGAGQAASGAISAANGALSDAEAWLIERESGGDVNAYNPQTTDSGNAAGIGQLTTANRQRIGAALGINPDTTDYNEQLQMMRYYIQERYGTPEAAVEFWKQNGWY